ncbi:hypothetical protein D3C75_963180 [compost metagenome]
MFERFALRFQASAKTCCNKSTEGETEQGQWQLRVSGAKPFGHSLGIIDFAGAHIMCTFTGTHPAVVETQSNQTGITRGALQGRDHFVEHGAALHRVRMADQRQATRLLVVQVQCFQLTHRAINHYRGFTHKQGRNSVTSDQVDSSSKLSVAVYCE